MDHTVSPDENGIRYFIVSWDCDGVEYLEDITKHHPNNVARQVLFDAIKNGAVDEDSSFGTLVNHLTLRARFNPHRNYEIYIFMASEGVTLKDIKQWTDEDPQSFADFVRKNYSGKIWDARMKREEARKIV